jgi:dienelactone hydrolase
VAKKVFPTLIFVAISTQCFTQVLNTPDTIIVRSENLELKALLWHPAAVEKLPAVIFCHGGYETGDSTYDVVQNVSSIGSLFAKHGYVFLGLFRRGVGLSKGEGENSADLMAKAFRKNGQEGRNKAQLQQLQTDQLQDILAGLNFFRNRSDVDMNRIVIAGHSLGGSLALLVAEHEPSLKAAVVFSPAGYSWDHSPQLRVRLITAVKKIQVPVMIIHAQNDYSVNPGYGLDSVMTALHKPHLLKIYPKFGETNRAGHNLIFLGTTIWEKEVFKFLDEAIKQ